VNISRFRETILEARLLVPVSAHDLDGVRKLFVEYAAALQIDLCFQNFTEELE
jgi:hypothetical protein